jgi:hypothetical protein
MKQRLRRVYLWFYEVFKGHLPLGTLVRFQPIPDVSGIFWSAPGDPPFGAVGIVVGGWRAYKNPGYTQRGSVVMIESQTYDVDDWEIVRVDD